MEKNVVMIDLVRYNELIKAQHTLETLKNIAEQDTCEYGYRKETTEIIDAILGVTRA
jgi:hypothetical protein